MYYHVFFFWGGGAGCALRDDFDCLFDGLAFVSQKCLSKGLMFNNMNTTSQSSPGPLRTSHLALRTFSDHIISGCGMERGIFEKRGIAIRLEGSIINSSTAFSISFNQLGLFCCCLNIIRRESDLTYSLYYYMLFIFH